MRTFLVVFSSATLVSILVTPLIIRLARYLDIVDRPDVRKVHVSAIPRIGGVAIFISMFAAILPVLALNNDIGDAFWKVQGQFLALFAASAIVFLVGLMDDVYDLGAWVKLGAQIVAAAVVCGWGNRMDEFEITQQFTLKLGWVSWPVTILWIIGITNAVNLIDGLDGLAAGLSVITCGVIAVFAIHSGLVVLAVMMLALLGSLTGFLVFNFNPAKIFMGDCGSMFLGFILASSSVMCVAKTATLVGLALAFLALGIPIFDTLFSILRRAMERRSLFAPDQNHIHHRLLQMGFGQRRSVMVIYIMAIVVSGLGLYMMEMKGPTPVIVFIFAIALLVHLFRTVGAVRLGDSFYVLRQNLAIARDAKDERRTFEHLQLNIRRAKSFGEWWQAICLAAEKMDFSHISLGLTKRDGTSETLVWQSNETEGEAGIKALHLSVPICDRRSESGVQLDVKVRINGSLESAGRRAALFTRLMDEYSLEYLGERHGH
jgi:UDP-GlcNAc:undecaprenyl-phosphate GlcNAc-1-phosphate transferase